MNRGNENITGTTYAFRLTGLVLFVFNNALIEGMR